MADVWTARVEAGNVLAVEAGGSAEIAAVGMWVGRRGRKETSCLVSLRLWMAKVKGRGGLRKRWIGRRFGCWLTWGLLEKGL